MKTTELPTSAATVPSLVSSRRKRMPRNATSSSTAATPICGRTPARRNRVLDTAAGSGCVKGSVKTFLQRELRVRVVVEEGDLVKTAGAIERLRLGQRAVGREPEDLGPGLACLRLERQEQPP